jgi:diguanylate cyclase (GGDEF)-like protein
MTQAGAGLPPYRLTVTRLAGAVLATAAAVATIGWGLDVSAVRSVVPGAVGMKILTALGLGAGAGALLLLGRSRRVGLLLALVPGLLGLAVLAEYVLHVKLGIDELLFVDHDGRAAGIAYPGRFAPTTAVCFVLLAGALLTLDRGAGRRWRPTELLAIPMVLTACMSLIAYAYSIPAFYGPSAAAKMAVNTACCFVALGIALLLCRTRGRLLELATTTDPGGVMLRRLVPLCVIVPLVLGWLRLRAVGWGLFGDAVGTWWLAAATIGGLVAVMLRCASTLSRSDRDRRALEDKLVELANRDPLTGLFTRRRFEEELDQLLARSRRYGDRGWLLLIDLDRLKPINDTFGHLVGDRILCAVADALTGRVRESDVVGRLGGDEFAVLLFDADRLEVEHVALQLLAAIAGIAIEADGATTSSSASIGVARVDSGGDAAASDCLARADTAMYRAKRDGGNRAVHDDAAPAVLATPARRLAPAAAGPHTAPPRLRRKRTSRR